MMNSVRLYAPIRMHSETLGLGIGPDHLAQFKFFGEFLVEEGEVVDQFARGLEDGSSRGEASIGSDAECEVAIGEQGVRIFNIS